MKKGKLILHIGPPKHGSSAIQEMLRSNKELLHDRGYQFYEQSWALAQSFRKNGYQRARSHFETEIQITDAPECVIVSAEDFFKANPEEVKNYFSNFADDIRIVWFLRRQDRVAVSHYLQQFKFLNYKSNCFAGKISYTAKSREWLETFGSDNAIVRPFQKSQWRDQDLIQDFLHHLEIPSGGFELSQFSNVSMTTLAKDCMRLVQDILYPYKQANDNLTLPRKRLHRFREFLERRFAEDVPFSPPRKTAVDYYSQFVRDNDQLVNDFGFRWKFNHEDFSMYEESPREMSSEEIVCQFKDALAEFCATEFTESDELAIDSLGADFDRLEAQILLLLLEKNDTHHDKRFLISLLRKTKNGSNASINPSWPGKLLSHCRQKLRNVYSKERT